MNEFPENPATSPLSPLSSSLTQPTPPPATSEAASMLGQVETFIRKHPLAAALVTLGFGVAVGVATHDLLVPEPTPKKRALKMLHDLQESISDILEPAADYASDLSHNGARAVKRGMHSVAESNLIGRIRDLFS